jgi:hypothetical protein
MRSLKRQCTKRKEEMATIGCHPSISWQIYLSSMAKAQKCKHENKMTNCGHMRRNGGKEVSYPRNALMVAVNAKLIAKK